MLGIEIAWSTLAKYSEKLKLPSILVALSETRPDCAACQARF
jgi:hypothetical protein